MAGLYMVVVVSISDQRNTEWLVCPSSLFMIIRNLDFWQIESFKTWLVSSTEELSPTSCKKYSKCWEILTQFLDQVACCIFQQKAMIAVGGLVLDKTQTTGSILAVTGSGCLRTAAVQCLCHCSSSHANYSPIVACLIHKLLIITCLKLMPIR